MDEIKAYTIMNPLNKWARLVLFLSSYLPLFAIICVRQIILNSDKLHWAGIHADSVMCFFHFFGFSFFLAFLCIVGIAGSWILFDNLNRRVENGVTVKIEEVSSLNEEPLAYVATYIIPFLFEKDYSLANITTLVVIFLVIYRLYINSKLILVNPIVSLKYSIYSIRYIDGEVDRQGILISKSKDLREQDYAKIYNVGYQLFYGYRREEK